MTLQMIDVIFYLLCFSTCGTLGNFQTFLTNSLFDHRVCSGAEQISVSTGHEWTSQCLYLCVRDPSCLSVFYNTDTGSCTRCYISYISVESLSESHGNVYYILHTKLYGERCFDDDICGGTNQVCWTDTCICQIGYSYHNVNGMCVEHCETYGTSFQKYPHRRLRGHNIKTRKGVTLEACAQFCIDFKTRTCISFDYNQDEMLCHLSKDSALTQPDDVDTYGEKCDTEGQCEGRNLECWDDTCICQIGYSYNPRTKTCVERCSEYGDTFQVYPDRRLQGMNDKKFIPVTLEGCKKRCLGYNCLSLEYKEDNSECHISKRTVLTDPEKYNRRRNCNYYTRNCAK